MKSESTKKLFIRLEGYEHLLSCKSRQLIVHISSSRLHRIYSAAECSKRRLFRRPRAGRYGVTPSICHLVSTEM